VPIASRRERAAVDVDARHVIAAISEHRRVPAGPAAHVEHPNVARQRELSREELDLARRLRGIDRVHEEPEPSW
jgi:hypothetical protein